MKTELLGGKPKNDLKDDAVPAFFNHKTIPKKRRASLDRDSRNIKKTIAEAALEDYPKEINSEIKEASTGTSDLVLKSDIGLNNVPKRRQKTVRTQCRESKYRRKFIRLFQTTRQDQI